MFVNSSKIKNAAIYAFLNGEESDGPALAAEQEVPFNPEL